MLSLIRTYYLFLYYKLAMLNKRKNGEPNTVQSYVAIAFLFVPQPLLFLIFWVDLSGLVSGVFDYMVIPILDTPRGMVTSGVVLVWGLGNLFTYFVCCYHIRFEDIPQRVSQYRFLSDLATWKAFLPIIAQTIVMFIFLMFI